VGKVETNAKKVNNIFTPYSGGIIRDNSLLSIFESMKGD
jgi:hypothetical protein